MKKRRIDLSKFSSIKIGPVTDLIVLERGDEPPCEHTLIGYASNILFAPDPPSLMMLGKDFDYIQKRGGELIVGAATPTGKLLSFCKRHDLGGFEYLTGLPGTVGGMVAMNAGIGSYETFDNLIEITTDKGIFAKRKIPHDYRFAKLPGIVFEAVFKVESGFDTTLAASFSAMRKKQPKEPSAGSIFKNPPGDYAGRLIEATGLKGFRAGDMAWSGLHANFLVNLGNGTFKDALALIKKAHSRVIDHFGIELELEIKIIKNEG